MGRNDDKRKPPSRARPDEPKSADEPSYRGWLSFKHNFPDGRSSFDKEFAKLPVAIQETYLELKERAAKGTARSGAVKHIGDGIYELKNAQSNNPYRLLYMTWGGFLVALTVFHKKDEKTDKTLALTRKKRWLDLSKKWAKPSS
ncbi:type II toxin-antitoxin system RelE/ParE family toxin [Aeromicrobium sp.]|uniref:type II toxin-antitoxin system RelE/ParE family toxin n=1 Tax=Aeromicrobium sp. TaxID=1871063 RepID=UPI002FCB0B2C